MYIILLKLIQLSHRKREFGHVCKTHVRRDDKSAGVFLQGVVIACLHTCEHPVMFQVRFLIQKNERRFSNNFLSNRVY